MDELGRGIEVDAHVEGGRVVSLDAVVGDVHAGVVLGPAAPLALGAVEDVRDAKFRQLPTIRCDVPAGRRLRILTSAKCQIGSSRVT